MKPFILGALAGLFVIAVSVFFYQLGFHAGVMHELLSLTMPI